MLKQLKSSQEIIIWIILFTGSHAHPTQQQGSAHHIPYNNQVSYIIIFVWAIILLLVFYPFRLLAELTTPTECLICIDASSNRSSTSQRIVIHELSQLLYSIKEAFLEPSAFEVVIDHLHELLEKVTLYHFHLLKHTHTRGFTCFDNVQHVTQKTTLSSEDCECVQHSLLLVRNILHLPQRPRNTVVDVESATSSAAQQPSHAQTPHQVPARSNGSSCTTTDCCNSQENQRLLWNLFAQKLDRLLINLLASPQKVNLYNMQLVKL